jgi:hypothetical protein
VASAAVIRKMAFRGARQEEASEKLGLVRQSDPLNERADEETHLFPKGPRSQTVNLGAP